MNKKASLRLNLARKYRPQSLEELSGQSSVVRILTEALKADRIAPAYLFSGPRGVGKTSSARIFAKAASCLNEAPAERPCGSCRSCEAIANGKMMDILEIDGASHTGVDDVRRIIESVAYRPTTGARNAYIIDEVHMLSNAAFNALLKTLEEPPSHALFLFATTEPEKVPSTILSRVQRLELQRLKDSEVFENLQSICKKENIKISLPVLEQISTAADGSLRDGQTLLEQMILLSASTEISEDVVDSFLGTIGSQQEIYLLQLISEQKSFELIEKIHQFFEKGKDLTKLLNRLILWTRALLLSQATQNTRLFETEYSPESIEKLQSNFRGWSVEDIDRLFEILWSGYERLKKSDLPKITLETTLLRACRIPKTHDLAQLLRYLETSPAQVSPQEPRPTSAKPTEKIYNSKSLPQTEEAPIKKPEATDDILSLLKRKRPSMVALLQMAEERKFLTDQMQVVFSEGHFAYRQLSDPLMLKDLESSLSEIAGKKFKVIILENSKSPDKSAPPPRTDLIKEAKRQAIEDPAIQEAAKILGGKISSVTIEGIKT